MHSTTQSSKPGAVWVDEPFEPDCARNTLLVRFPWTLSWRIHVSSGYIELVDQLLQNIEDILGKNPPLDFLRIIEQEEEQGPTRRKIHVFIEPRQCSAAKSQAIRHAIHMTGKWAERLCPRCGDKLVTVNPFDEDTCEMTPELIAFLKARSGPFRSRTIEICLPCLQLEWESSHPFGFVEESGLEVSDEDEDCDEAIDGDEPWDEACPAEENESGEDCADAINDDAPPDEVQNSAVEQAVKAAIFKAADIDLLEKTCSTATRDQSSRAKALISSLRETEPDKPLTPIPDDWRSVCDDLDARFPNFKDVTEFLRSQFALSDIGDRVIRSAPVLLVGEPGIGKTEYLHQLAEAVAGEFIAINIGNSQTNSTLAGSERYWSNSHQGRLFDALVFGTVANPIIMLDEIDKAGGQYDKYKPLSALHQLLEPRQARNFYDLSVPEIKFDASHILWVASANDLDMIEKPIVDRFTVFGVEKPTPAQMTAVVNNIYRRFLAEHPSGAYFDSEIRPDTMALLCAHPPRKVRKLVEGAFGFAAREARNYLLPEDIRDSEKNKRHTIGFVR
ncbi:AAA family ATPase [Methylotuvimicrobium sp. KM2]|uniref:AAA family ATPase n=1 Tax=Methylotuvimicrobium sp. KM2 TaxID=3133976 RepID=UPI0031015762